MSRRRTARGARRTASCAGASRSISPCSAWPPRARLDDGVVDEARIVITGAGSRPHEATAAAALLVGRAPRRRDAIAEAADAAARLAKPLDNTDFALGWRKEMARHHVTAALADLA